MPDRKPPENQDSGLMSPLEPWQSTHFQEEWRLIHGIAFRFR